MKPFFNALAFLLLASIASTAPVAAARASNQQASQAALRGSNNEAARHMKEKNIKQQTTGGGDTEIESRLANCAVRGNTATVEPKAISGTSWLSLVSGGNLCTSDCDCASGCCGWFWVNICVEPSMQGMKCRGTGTTDQQPEDEVPGTGSGGDDNQETLVIATPAGNIDDVPSVTPPLETPVEPKETASEGISPDSDIPGTPAESFYPVEYPEGHPNAIESKETATESKEIKEGRDAGPGAKSKKSKGPLETPVEPKETASEGDEEGAVTEPKKSFNNKGDAADKSRSKTGAKALSNRKKKQQQQQHQEEEEEEEKEEPLDLENKTEDGAGEELQQQQEEEEEEEEPLDLENKTEDGAGEELLDNYDFSNGWPEWNADMCQQSSQCKSNCCAWAHSFVCISKTTWMGRFTCIE